MVSACCCYIINEGYLFPTLVSALQARAAASVDTADIKIFCIGKSTRTVALYREICASHGIDLVSMPSEAIDGMPIMFARFYLSRLLEAKYDSVVYLDGDTQINGSLEPLLAVPLEPGRFLAARDPMSIMIEAPSREWGKRRAYFRSIGLPPDALPRYCNSGVLRFNLRDWGAISLAALAVSATHDHALKFPDQDALNLVFGKDYIPMSYRWNFPIFFLGCGFEDLIEPIVYHFMSNPRPWNGAFQPWGEAWHAPYRRVVEAHPELRRFHRPFRMLRATRYMAQQRIKSLLEGPTWSSDGVRDRIARHEAEAYV